MAIVTVSAGGGYGYTNYTTLSAALAACPSDITAAGTNENWEIHCYADAPSGSVSISGKTTDATHRIRIYVPSGQRSADGVTGGFTIAAANTLLGLTISSVVAVTVEGVRFINGTPTPNGGIEITGAVAMDILLRDCIFQATGARGGVWLKDRTSGAITMVNCTGYFGSSGLPLIRAASGSGYTVRCYNCTGFTTSTGGDYLFWNGAGVTFICKNCVAEYGSTYHPYNGTISGNNNVSSSSSCPGTSGTTSSL